MSRRSAPVRTQTTPGIFSAARRVDRDDAPVRDRAAQHLPVQHARHEHVADELRLPAELLAGVAARCGAADLRLRPSTVVVIERRRAPRPPRGIRDSRYSGRGCRPGCAGSPPRSRARREASRALTVSSIPGVQKPHWRRRVPGERLLEALELGLLGESFDRRHLPPCRVGGEVAARADREGRRRGRCRRRRPAPRTSVFAPVRARRVAEEVEQELLRRDVAGDRRSVDAKRDLHRALPRARELSLPGRPSIPPRTRPGT